MIIPELNEVAEAKKVLAGKKDYAIGMALAEHYDHKYFHMDYVYKGFIGAICMKQKPWEAIIELCEAIGDNKYNYCDMDCDLWAFTVESDSKCIFCENPELFEELGINSKNCNCHNGVDLKHYKHYFLIHSNHGNSFVYHTIVDKNGFYHSVNIRRLPYNLSDEELVYLGKTLAGSVKEDSVEHELLRYKDSRDKGFSLSFRCESKFNGVANIDTCDYSGYDLDYINEHLKPLINEIKGE